MTAPRLCPACNTPLVGVQVYCSRDCAAAEMERRADNLRALDPIIDEEMGRAARVEAAPPVVCTYCGEGAGASPEADEPQDVCVDCGVQRAEVEKLLLPIQNAAHTHPAAAAVMLAGAADRIMRLFLSGGAK